MNPDVLMAQALNPLRWRWGIAYNGTAHILRPLAVDLEATEPSLLSQCAQGRRHALWMRKDLFTYRPTHPDRVCRQCEREIRKLSALVRVFLDGLSSQTRRHVLNHILDRGLGLK
jgi:hypothetical protein